MEKPLGQFGIHDHLCACIELLDKCALCFRVCYDIIVYMAFERIACLAEILLALPSVKMSISCVSDSLVAQMLDNDCRFLLLDKARGLGDEVFRIGPELVKTGLSMPAGSL